MSRCGRAAGLEGGQTVRESQRLYLPLTEDPGTSEAEPKRHVEEGTGWPEEPVHTQTLKRKTVVFKPTYRLGVLHPFPDLVSEVFNQVKYLITDLHRILDNSHGAEQGSASSGSQLWRMERWRARQTQCQLPRLLCAHHGDCQQSGSVCQLAPTSILRLLGTLTVPMRGLA